MKFKHSWLFAIALTTASSVSAQGVGPRPAGPGPIGPFGPGPVGPGPVGPGPIGSGPVGPGPVGVGPVGPGPVGSGPFGPGPLGLGPIGPFPGALMDLVRGIPSDLPWLPDMHLLDDQDRGRDRETAPRERERARAAELYDQAYEAITDSRWDRAAAGFSRVVALNGSQTAAALYWMAYAQNRQGQRAEALTTIAKLTNGYPTSLYVKQARALEVEVRNAVGQAVRPQDQADEDLKLMAIQALQQSAPEQAIPMLEKVLDGTASPRLKERALYVLAQSDSPRARDVLRKFAKGGSTPELQSKAIQYLGVHGGSESRALLGEIYATSTDVDVKRRILRAFMVAGEKERLWKAAQGEQNPELRAEAVRQLGVMGAHEELWQLYQKESSIDVRKQVLRAMFVGGNSDRMIDLARTEKNPELRRDAVRNLGLMGSPKTGEALVQIYGTDRDAEIRKAVINALFLQQNATSLVALVRKEEDVNMKKEIVQKLALINSKVATDYMIELLGK
jgi:HEAT repeat protein